MSHEFAVLFDVDGVLVDSYYAHWNSWRKLGREEGFDMDETFFAATFGRTSRDVLPLLLPNRVWKENEIKEFDERKEAFYRECIREDFPAMTGAVELIDALANAGVGLAVGSSAPPENVHLTLEKLARRAVFGAVITGGDVVRGKPDPQVFLLGAERLKVPPHRCIVIEDAPAGIEAARRAGMKSVGLASTGRHPCILRDASRVVWSLSELNVAFLRDMATHE